MTETAKEETAGDLYKRLQTMDASVWAKEFKKLNPESDEGLMLAWFANSIMCGYDIANKRSDEKFETIRTIANALYRHECWNEMPWGAKQVLLSYVDEETKEAYSK